MQGHKLKFPERKIKTKPGTCRWGGGEPRGTQENIGQNAKKKKGQRGPGNKKSGLLLKGFWGWGGGGTVTTRARKKAKTGPKVTQKRWGILTRDPLGEGKTERVGCQKKKAIGKSGKKRGGPEGERRAGQNLCQGVKKF